MRVTVDGKAWWGIAMSTGSSVADDRILAGVPVNECISQAAAVPEILRGHVGDDWIDRSDGFGTWQSARHHLRA
jgi:hypothetical protein